jgi:hypothetical protein
MTRRRLMEAAGAVSHGMEPPGLDPAEQRARAVSMVAPRELSLLEAVAEAQRNRTITGAAA